jgi:hypothetical protein
MADKHPIIKTIVDNYKESVEDNIKSSSYCRVCNEPVDVDINWFGDFSFSQDLHPCKNGCR